MPDCLTVSVVLSITDRSDGGSLPFSTGRQQEAPDYTRRTSGLDLGAAATLRTSSKQFLRGLPKLPKGQRRTSVSPLEATHSITKPLSISES